MRNGKIECSVKHMFLTRPLKQRSEQILLPLEQHYEFKILSSRFINDVHNDKSNVMNLEHLKSSFFFLYFLLSRFQWPLAC
jgi:hypothetical protein